MNDILKHGFLGNDASFMLDFVVCSLVLVVPWLLFSLFLVKFRNRYNTHRILQVLLGLVLLVAVTAFEVDMRLHGGWENIVNKSERQPRLTAGQLDTVRGLLRVHLIFAITTPFLWAATLGLAWRRFSNPPTPGAHSRLHIILGWATTVDITLTSVTGLAFYYVTFIRPPL